MQVSKVGDWKTAARALSRAAQGTKRTIARAVQQEAHYLRTLIVQGLTNQRPGGNEALRPISELTRAQRRLRNFQGTKALIVRGDLRNSIAVVPKSDSTFVGVLRRVRTRGGKPLVDLAQVHEFGVGPIIIPITPAMRRYLHVLLRTAGGTSGHPAGNKRVVVLVVPPRPFLRPAREKFDKGAHERFARRFTRLLQGGHP